MVDQFGGKAHPRSQVPDLSNVDLDSLPVMPADPLRDYYAPSRRG